MEDPSEYAVQREYSWRFIIGMSAETFVALWEKQDGRCAICKTPMKLGRMGAYGTNVVVDHSHASGNARGLLCSLCNSGLGNFLDDPELLLKAAEYLKNPPLRLDH